MRIFLHIVIWILIWLWMTSVYLYNETDFISFLLFNLLRLPVIIASGYIINYYVVYRNLVIPVPNIKTAMLIFLCVFTVASLLDRFISSQNLVKPTLDGVPLDYQFVNPLAIFKNAFILFSILVIFATIEFFSAMVKQQKDIFNLRAEKLETELALLRNQVNPHFMYNAFNNLYSMAVRNGNDELAKGISGMAGLMKYLTYESHTAQVPVIKEAQLLLSLIEVEKIRLGSDDAFINFRTEGELSDVSIAPVLLLPILENAFKHGASPDQPVWIDVLLKRGNNELCFKVMNKKIVQPNKTPAGIGLKNLKKRLDLVYANRHSLTIGDEAGMFTVTMTLAV